MLAERVCFIGGTSGEVLIKVKLLSQCFASPDLFCLAPLLLPDRVRGGENFLNTLEGRKQHPVGICKDNVLTCDDDFAELGRSQCLRRRRIEPPRTGGKGSITKNWKSDLTKLDSIAVATPNNDPCQPPSLCFECGQVSDAALIHPALIVDNQDIARLGNPHRLQEDIHAAIMSGRQSATGDLSFSHQWVDPRRREPQRNMEAHASIRDQRCGKLGERFTDLLIVHRTISFISS